jgi:hypothetical protein
LSKYTYELKKYDLSLTTLDAISTFGSFHTKNRIFGGCTVTTFHRKNQQVLYNLIFPLWVYPFIIEYIPLFLAPYFAVYAIIVWLYLKKHKKFNNLKIYCFRAFGSEKTTQREINRGVVFGYAFKAAVFAYFANVLGGMALIWFLKTPPFSKYIDTDFIWSNFISGLVHVLVVLLVGLLIYLYHRRAGRSLNLTAAETHGLGLVMGILTAPWFFFLPIAWLR